ncbi:hypothetical protein HY635_01735 [Candidatus Uhrbacteria bacterium]|nr:hypothetical protein [Candidatus Uhrbacteria bacterium]
MMTRRSIIAKITDHNFTKEFKRFEYETKFSIATRKNALAFLRDVERCFRAPSHFLLVRIAGGDKLVTRVSFFVRNNREYSYFVYRRARMLKVKRHDVMMRGGLPIFKNEESLLIDCRDFADKLHHLRHRFVRHSYRLVDLGPLMRRLRFNPTTRVGEMIKTRVKDFVLDTRDGRVYAVAVTFCASRGRTQKQLEVEYAGYIAGVPGRTANSEREIVARTVELSKYIQNCLPAMLTLSTERKYTFVTRGRAV